MKMNLLFVMVLALFAFSTNAMAQGLSYSNTDLTHQSFNGKDLRGSTFSNTTIDQSSFDGANLEGSTFSNTDFTNVTFRNVNFRNTTFSNVTFNGGDLRGASFDGATISNTDFLQGIKMHGVDLTGASTSNVSYDGADFDTAEMVGSTAIAETLTKAPTGDKYHKQANINLAILFEFDSDKISGASWGQIEELSKALSTPELANAKILIEGHTDSKGSDEYNDDLSYRRAFSVRKALVSQLGISEQRLSVKGYGEARPVAGNDTDAGRAQNRRVTIVNLGN